MSAVEALGGTAAGLIAFGVIWQKALRPFWRAMRVMEDALPVLLGISAEFHPNGGNSLRDRINEIDRKADVAAQGSDAAVSAAQTAELVAETNAAIVKELTSTSMAELRGIETYIHDQAHITRNALQAHVFLLSNLSKQNAIITAKLEKMEPLVDRHREDDR